MSATTTTAFARLLVMPRAIDKPRPESSKSPRHGHCLAQRSTVINHRTRIGCRKRTNCGSWINHTAPCDSSQFTMEILIRYFSPMTFDEAAGHTIATIAVRLCWGPLCEEIGLTL